MEKLFKLGMLPKENAKGGLKAQVEWYLEYEAMLKSIIDLGSKDEELNMLAFNKNTVADIVNMFPANIMKKLIKCPGIGRLRLENIRILFIRIVRLRSGNNKNNLRMSKAQILPLAKNYFRKLISQTQILIKSESSFTE